MFTLPINSATTMAMSIAALTSMIFVPSRLDPVRELAVTLEFVIGMPPIIAPVI
jgi:hypothetical protein